MSTAFDYGTGRRKTAIARTRLYPGSGQIEINGRPMDQYFPRKTLQMIVRQPLALTKLSEQYDIKVNVCGGGISGQPILDGPYNGHGPNTDRQGGGNKALNKLAVTSPVCFGLQPGPQLFHMPVQIHKFSCQCP